ncbi:MAG: phosphate ABC transporter permease family protein, partial [Paracoccaceae bacterium]|nr:phosphate ABC transporter permease family protein [Paracoccaceae bacterium]
MTLLAFALLFIAVVAAYALNRLAAVQIWARGERMHSLAGFHGLYAALLVLLPGFVLIMLWLLSQGTVIDALVMNRLPEGTLEGLAPGAVHLALAEIKSIAAGQVFGTPEDWKLAAAERMNTLHGISSMLMVAIVVALSVLSMLFARYRVSAEFRARHGVERIVLGIMIFCSTVAIFTTAGIVLSLIYESYEFFRLVPLTEFLFGTNWEPQIPIRA